MVYDRRIGDRTLSFEPSGGLLQASLVMRDRETDSWWSIMRGEAIGGPLDGAPLVELPVGEKTTWGEWRKRHPETLALAHGGRSHRPENGYAGYFASDRTFRGITIGDDRLPAKEPVFAFRLGGVAYAAAHRSLVGGALFAVREGGEREVFLHRGPGASVLESTVGFVVPAGAVTRAGDGFRLAAGKARLDRRAAFARLERTAGVEKLAGVDTYWYTWASVNDGTRILPPPGDGDRARGRPD